MNKVLRSFAVELLQEVVEACRDKSSKKIHRYATNELSKIIKDLEETSSGKTDTSNSRISGKREDNS